jgi:hypothetical protein
MTGLPSINSTLSQKTCEFLSKNMHSAKELPRLMLERYYFCNKKYEITHAVMSVVGSPATACIRHMQLRISLRN